MRDDRGAIVTDQQVLDRVAAIGTVVVVREPDEGSGFTIWRRGLRRAAGARGLRLWVRRVDELIIISNPRHLAPAPPPPTTSTSTPPATRARPHLRLVPPLD